jgi:flagellar hook protein FlgE
MSLLNSLFAGVSGLRNHQTMLDVIGNNIANVNSIGFKGSRVTFSDTFNQYVRYGTDPTTTTGGTNSFQVGLGMKVNSIDRNWTQGTFERTGLTTDLAIQGEGLFVLKSNGKEFYSRAGAFIFDADGKLVNPQNGAIVQGKVATSDGAIPPGNTLQDIFIDTNLRLPAVATTKTSWGGNLNSTSTLTRTENFVQNGNINSTLAVGDTVTDSNTIYDNNGNAYTMNITYTKTAADTFDMTYDLVDSNGATVIGGPVTTALVFNGATGALQTIGGNPPATIPIANVGLGIDYNFDIRNITQTAGTTTISSTVDENRQPTIVTGTLSVFDSLGNPHSITLKFTKTGPNQWNWNTSVPTPATLAQNSGTISFNTDGSINSISPNPPIIRLTPGGGASPQNIQLDFGSGFTGITQTSSNSVVSALSQNGSAAASLSNVNIDQYGYIVGVFTNGESRNLAQILVATFANKNGLTSAGDNMYTVSPNSGAALIGEPGEGTRTTLQSGALEQSNVDLSEEFTKMIVSQRGFQANARVVTTSDTLLQEITNLVR